MTCVQNKRLLLMRRPRGEPVLDDFKWDLESISTTLRDGDVLVQVRYISLDPAMRGWMSQTPSYLPPVKLGTVMRAGAIGLVYASANPKFNTGEWVSSAMGVQSFCLVPGGKDLFSLPARLPPPLQLTAFLSVLGITGLTAYTGLLTVGQLKRGESVLVSGAAGATGSVVVQIAKHVYGCRVVGTAGSDDKCNWLKSIGCDDAVNYKSATDLTRALRQACPDGVDVVFDNVGGEFLDSALLCINQNARIIICGAISAYNDVEPPPGPKNYLALLVKRARMEGFIIIDHMQDAPAMINDLTKWVVAGHILYKEDIVHGIENYHSALMKLFRGTNDGKLILAVDQSKPSSKF